MEHLQNKTGGWAVSLSGDHVPKCTGREKPPSRIFWVCRRYCTSLSRRGFCPRIPQEEEFLLYHFLGSCHCQPRQPTFWHNDMKMGQGKGKEAAEDKSREATQVSPTLETDSPSHWHGQKRHFWQCGSRERRTPPGSQVGCWHPPTARHIRLPPFPVLLFSTTASGGLTRKPVQCTLLASPFLLLVCGMTGPCGWVHGCTPPLLGMSGCMYEGTKAVSEKLQATALHAPFTYPEGSFFPLWEA